MILFFGGLAFAILFHQLSEQDEEIQTLRFPKKETEEDKRFAGFMDKRKKDEIEAAKDIFALSPKSRKELYKQMGLIKDEKDEVTPQKSEEIQVIFYKKNLNKLKDNDKN